MSLEPAFAGRESERSDMGISLNLFLIAIGAVLAWAVDAELSGIDIQGRGDHPRGHRSQRVPRLARLLVELGWLRQPVTAAAQLRTRPS
jgi:hypothetical protein